MKYKAQFYSKGDILILDIRDREGTVAYQFHLDNGAIKKMGVDGNLLRVDFSKNREYTKLNNSFDLELDTAPTPINVRNALKLKDSDLEARLSALRKFAAWQAFLGSFPKVPSHEPSAPILPLGSFSPASSSASPPPSPVPASVPAASVTKMYTVTLYKDTNNNLFLEFVCSPEIRLFQILGDSLSGTVFVKTNQSDLEKSSAQSLLAIPNVGLRTEPFEVGNINEVLVDKQLSAMFQKIFDEKPKQYQYHICKGGLVILKDRASDNYRVVAKWKYTPASRSGGNPEKLEVMPIINSPFEEPLKQHEVEKTPFRDLDAIPFSHPISLNRKGEFQLNSNDLSAVKSKVSQPDYQKELLLPSQKQAIAAKQKADADAKAKADADAKAKADADAKAKADAERQAAEQRQKQADASAKKLAELKGDFERHHKDLSDQVQDLIDDLNAIKIPASSADSQEAKSVEKLKKELDAFNKRIGSLKFPQEQNFENVYVEKIAQFQKRLGDLQVYFAPRKYYLYEGGFVVEEIDAGDDKKFSSPIGKWRISSEGKIKIDDLTNSETAQYQILLEDRNLDRIDYDPKNPPEVTEEITSFSNPIKGQYYLQDGGAVFFVESDQEDAQPLYVGNANTYGNRLVIDSTGGLRPGVNFSIDDSTELKSAESAFGLTHFDYSDEELQNILEYVPEDSRSSGRPHLFPGNIVALVNPDGTGKILGRWERVSKRDVVRDEAAGVVGSNTSVDKIRLIQIDNNEKNALEGLLIRKAFKEKAIPFNWNIVSDSTIDLLDSKNQEIKQKLENSNNLALPGYYRFRADGLIEFCPEEGAPKPPGFFLSLFGKKKPKDSDYIFIPVGTWKFDDEDKVEVSYSLAAEDYKKTYLSEEVGYYHLWLKDKQMRNLGYQFTEEDFDPKEVERAKEDFDKYNPEVEASAREQRLREDKVAWKTSLERQEYSVRPSYHSGHEDRDIIRTPSNNVFWHDKKMDTVGIPPNAFFKNSNVVDDYVKLLSRMCKPKLIDKPYPEMELVIRFSERMQPFKQQILDAIKKEYKWVEFVEAKDRDEFKKLLSSEAPSPKRKTETPSSEEPASKLPKIVRGSP